jgi:glycosyltransferase involved in cell wall biosynthesis
MRVRIAMVAPPWYSVPPAGYGGIEMMCASLIEGLLGRGHDVTLFGAGTQTRTGATFVSTLPELQYRRVGEALPEALHVARVNTALATTDFDVVHDHTIAGPLTAAGRSAPTVHTVHGPLEADLGDYMAALGPEVALVAISENQRRSRSDLHWVATVHNAVSLAEFPFRADPGEEAIWLARFNADKGPVEAIAASAKAGVPLTLIGKANEPSEVAYLNETVKPQVGPGSRILLNADRSQVLDLLSRARCLLLPLQWEEPFGMVMIEAMACGTPVVALRRGAAPEIVSDGVTGFLCDTVEELPAAIQRAAELDRHACRDRVESAFTSQVMAERYEGVYTTAIAAWRRGTGPLAEETASP